MRAFVLVNPGFEELAVKEIAELIKVKGKIAGSGAVEFEAKRKEDFVLLSYNSQSFKKILIGLDKKSSLNKIDLSKANWEDYFVEGFSFKAEVEGVKGNEKRLRMGKTVGSKVFLAVKKKLGFELKVEMKKPDIVVLVFFDGKNYFLGIDFCGYELTKRAYRVFVNPASFRGDLAYYLIRKSGFVRDEKLVVGFVKDGTMAIEAGAFNFGLRVNKDKFAFEKMPAWEKIDVPPTHPRLPAKKAAGCQLSGFDSSMMNIKAAKKNAKIAGVSELIELSKFDLDEMDVKFKEGEVDRLIFQITKKDEDKLNEIYYQANYVLRKKGTLLIIGRSSWEISVSDRFKLLSEEEIKRGESAYKVWVMEKR